MKQAQLSLDQAPSLITPLRFLATAPLFIIFASLLMLYTGPEILENRWLPQTLALTHSITLGFISMVIIGALFQILPVLAGCNIPYANHISLFIYLLLTPGTAFLITGFMFSNPLSHQISLFLLAPAFLVFLITVSIPLFSSASKLASAHGIKLSISSYWIALSFAFILLVSYAWPQIPLARQYTELHISWSMGGWILISIVSVAYQVIPMFQVTREYPDFLKKTFSPLILITLLIVSLTHFYDVNTGNDTDWLKHSVIILCSLLILSFVYISIQLLLQRKKRMADYSLWFWICGLFCLSASVIIYDIAILTHYELNMVFAVLFLVGFAVSIITGMLLKIIPFLVWLHLHQKIRIESVKRRRVPVMTEIISYKKGRLLFISYALALLTTLFSILYSDVFFYPAALLWMTYSSLLFVFILQSAYIYTSFDKN